MDMTNIVAKSTELNNSMTEVNRSLKRLASIKCRLKKMPGLADFETRMTTVLQEEQLLKSVRDYLTGPRVTVNDLTQDIIDNMSYDETCKAIRAIQSKKTHTKWADDCLKDPDTKLFIPGSGESYKEACRIEEMLVQHRTSITPTAESSVSKAELLNFIDSLKGVADLDTATCIRRLVDYIQGGAV